MYINTTSWTVLSKDGCFVRQYVKFRTLTVSDLKRNARRMYIYIYVCVCVCVCVFFMSPSAQVVTVYLS
jgi:glycopeptide antibiotics resistance protein